MILTALGAPDDRACPAGRAVVDGRASRWKVQLRRPSLSTSRLTLGSRKITRSISIAPWSRGKSLSDASIVLKRAKSDRKAPGGFDSVTSLAVREARGNNVTLTGPMMCRSRPVLSFTKVSSLDLTKSAGMKKGAASAAIISAAAVAKTAIASFFTVFPGKVFEPFWVRQTKAHAPSMRTKCTVLATKEADCEPVMPPRTAGYDRALIDGTLDGQTIEPPNLPICEPKRTVIGKGGP